ncbi:MAG TPA: AI-2E family transporter, partial [Acidimicrobiales bacterium]|nr:AI-2E family transporter [Acidimicrobiales bacterium]
TTVSRSVASYVAGTVALSFLFGLVVLVTNLILGVPFALLIALWVALVAMIPLVGGLIAAIPSVLLALLHSPTAGIVMLIVFVGFQLVENHLLYPLVMSKSVRMNPLWVLLSILVGANLGGVFGSALGGLAGALIAIPVGGAVQVVSREVWERTKAREPGPVAELPAAPGDRGESADATPDAAAPGEAVPAGVGPRA